MRSFALILVLSVSAVVSACQLPGRVLTGNPPAVLAGTEPPRGQQSNDWLLMNPSPSPSTRFGLAMAYDGAWDRTLLFGGYVTGYVLNGETWAYDFGGNTWSRRNPPTAPTPRALMSMAYDNKAGRVVLFGGWDGSIDLQDTWAYDFGANQWTNMNPLSSPPGRDGYGLVYDSTSDRFVLFGGWDLNSRLLYGETWAYDLNTNTWANMNPANGPPGRVFHAMAYDAQADRTILFGGCINTSIPCNPDNATWSYDFSANTWTNMTPVGGLTGRHGHVMAYDSLISRILLFEYDTWAYDFGTNAWMDLNPVPEPNSRMYPGFAYDAQSDRAILFGGGDYSSMNNETWAYHGAPGPPSAPRNLQVAGGEGEVTLSWQRPALDGFSPITAYRIYRGNALGSESFLEGVGNVLTFVDTGLTNGVTYYYEVSAINALGEGPLSNEAATTPGYPEPPTLTDAFLAGAGFSDLDLVWRASSDEALPGRTVAYDVLRAPSIGGTYTEIAAIPTTGSASYTYICAGCGHNATDGSPSFFKVRAVTPGPLYSDSAIGAKYAALASQGWNLFSVPLVQGQWEIGMVLRTLSFDTVRAYRADDPVDPWKAYYSGRPGDLETLRFGDGFWVHALSSGYWTIAGLVDPSPAFLLRPAWNLLAYASFVPATRIASLAAVSGVRAVQTFNPGSTDPYALRTVPPDELLSPGGAYWIWVAAGGGGDWVQG